MSVPSTETCFTQSDNQSAS